MDGCVFGWTNGPTDDPESILSLAPSGGRGNNTFNVPTSTFFIEFSDKPAAILKMAAILKTTTWRTWPLIKNC